MSESADTQRSVAKAAIDGGWSVRETERAVRRAGTKHVTIASKGVIQTADANMKAAETKLMRRLSTNVKIHPAKKGSGGKIEIEYYGVDDLDRIYELIMNKEIKEV
jgi:ParB family chromosome partitioning protein